MYKRYVKRFIDICISAVGLVIASPIFLITGIVKNEPAKKSL